MACMPPAAWAKRRVARRCMDPVAWHRVAWAVGQQACAVVCTGAAVQLPLAAVMHHAADWLFGSAVGICECRQHWLGSIGEAAFCIQGHVASTTQSRMLPGCAGRLAWAGCRKDKEAALVQAVADRHTLKMGEDVVELDAWGMDAYTRKNVFDGEAAAPQHRTVLRSAHSLPRPAWCMIRTCMVHDPHLHGVHIFWTCGAWSALFDRAWFRDSPMAVPWC